MKPVQIKKFAGGYHMFITLPRLLHLKGRRLIWSGLLPHRFLIRNTRAPYRLALKFFAPINFLLRSFFLWIHILSTTYNLGNSASPFRTFTAFCSHKSVLLESSPSWSNIFREVSGKNGANIQAILPRI